MRSTRAGPWFWRLLHGLAELYDPRRHRRAMERMLTGGLLHLFPCRYCRRHYRIHLARRPPRLGSRDALVRWVVALHNDVNATLGKPRVGLREGRAFGQRQARFVCRNARMVTLVMVAGVRARAAKTNKKTWLGLVELLVIIAKDLGGWGGDGVRVGELVKLHGPQHGLARYLKTFASPAQVAQVAGWVT
jgi:hypothetical protein